VPLLTHGGGERTAVGAVPRARPFRRGREALALLGARGAGRRPEAPEAHVRAGEQPLRSTGRCAERLLDLSGLQPERLRGDGAPLKIG